MAATRKRSGVGEVSNNVPTIKLSDYTKEALYSYGKEVVEQRAVPDFRDGLKPVHRFSLWALYKLGSSSTSGFKKAARVVGDCFVEGTLITTRFGRKPIEKIKVGDFVATSHGYKEVVDTFVRKASKELLKITLKNGLTVTATQDQLFKVLKSDLSYSWVRAKDLSYEDNIIYGFDHKIQTDFDHAAYFIGCYIANGHVDSKGGKYNRISICTPNIGVLDALIECCEVLFDHTPNITVRRLGNVDLYSIRVPSRYSEPFLQEYGLMKYAQSKYIPASLLANNTKLNSVLAGMFDCDGCVRKDRTEITYTTTSKKLLRQLRTALVTSGMHTTICKVGKVGNTSLVLGKYVCTQRTQAFNLSISGSNAISLRDRLPMQNSDKLHKLDRFSARRKLSCNNERLPNMTNAIKEELAKYYCGGGWYLKPDGTKFRSGLFYTNGDKYTIKGNLTVRQCFDFGIVDTLKLVGSPVAKTLNAFRKYGMSVSAVDNIIVKPAETTYDIEVADAHEFFANGILVHNCIGQYSPHGDQSTYKALVGMVGVYESDYKSFSMKHVNVPLIEGYGNFGDAFENAAGMRYPENRLTEFSENMLLDPIYMKVIEYEPNFSDDAIQPIVLPAKLPIILLNGSSSIAVGVAAGCPAFEYKGVLEATKKFLSGDKVELKELVSLLVPTFEYGGTCISDKKDIASLIKTGKGRLRWKPKTLFDSKTNILKVVSLCPGLASTNTVVTMMQKMLDLPFVKNVYDASADSKVSYEIHFDKKLKGDALLTALEKCGTMLERNESYDLGVTWRTKEGAEFSRPSFLQLFDNWCKWRVELEISVLKSLIEVEQKKLNHLNLMILAVDSIDIIVKSLKVDDSNAYLVKNLKITKEQAEEILEMRVRQLKKLERKNLLEKVKECERILKELKSDLKKPNVRVVKQLSSIKQSKAFS